MATVRKTHAHTTLAVASALGFVLAAGVALADGNGTDRRGRGSGGGSRSACSATAAALFAACKSETMDDAFTAKAKCINVRDAGERAACIGELRAERDENTELCREQRDGRLEACDSLGEDRYDPDLSPALFDDPRSPTNPNPYFPLSIGDRWEFHTSTREVGVVEIVDETKLIAGVTCIVARDRVEQAGDLVEFTDDWYCPAKNGDVWYFGEETKSFEFFDGDNPRLPELVSIDGSFKAQRDRDKPGIIFLATPKVGDVYIEEFSLGNAEDVTEILSTMYAFGTNPDLDQGVPQPLAERMCTGDCVVTKNFSLLEPGIFARKYYARGIGVFLEVESEGDVLQLVDCNFDSRCVGLPQP